MRVGPGPPTRFDGTVLAKIHASGPVPQAENGP
jgi:hypothetical protein